MGGEHVTEGILSKFKLTSHKKFRHIQPRFLIAAFAAVILLGSQVERFISHGTILGYQLRKMESQAAKSNQNMSGSILGATVSKTNQKSIACDTFPANKVSQKLKQDVERVSGFVADKTDPYIISSCIYRTKDAAKKRTVALLIREQKDKQAAQKTLQTLKSGAKGEVIKGVGDEAFFNVNANQLTVRTGKKLFTVTVPRTENSEDNKAIAIDIVKIAV